jgi:putative tryptophan/tyrosine transport system substrate-binding protein
MDRAFSAMHSALCILAAMLLTVSVPAAAQQPVKVYRIGVLSEGTVGLGPFADIQLFRQSLRGLGYIEGKNVIIEYRTAEGNRRRLPDLVAELIHRKVDVIVATSGVPARVASQATRMIPIVVTVSGDPIAEGLTASLAHPDRNVTGLTIQAKDLSGKRLELLKETIPGISRVAVFSRPPSTGQPAARRETETVAHTLGLEIKLLGVEATGELNSAFDAVMAWGAHALVPLSHRSIAIQRSHIVELAAKRRLPALYANRGFVEAGGLMSYGPNHSDLQRRAAFFVDKILRGVKPSELPVERPTRFELVINLKAAKQIGFAFPPEALMWADEVIK